MKKDNINKTNQNSSQSHHKQVDKEQKILFWIMSIFAVVLLSAGVMAYISSEKHHAERYETAIDKNSKLANELSFRDSLINEWVETFNEIEKDLVTMQEKENILKFNTTDPELTKDIRERIKTEIRHLNTLLKENKAKIAALNTKLEKSGVKIAALKKKVIQLEKAIDKRDRTLADLKYQLIEKDFEFAELNMLIDSLDYELLLKNEELSKNKARLNKAYIASGTKKELRERGLLEKEGGFLGLLGKSKTISTTLTNDEFQEINIKQTDKIAVNAKKLEFISDHPQQSYEIIENDSLIAYVKIKDPDAFWKITRYAVVETK